LSFLIHTIFRNCRYLSALSPRKIMYALLS